MIGISAPPQFGDESLLVTTFTGAAQALPARGSGEPWRYSTICLNLGTAQSIAWGDSSIDASAQPFLWMNRQCPMIVVNLMGATHVSCAGTGGGRVRFSPVDNVPQRGASVLGTPPQIGNAIDIDTSAGAASTAIPNDAAGRRARYIMLSQSSATALEVGFGDSSFTGVHMFVQADAGPVIVNVAGHTHIRTASLASNTLTVAAVEF